MTQPLISPGDPDIESWQEGDQDFYLAAASAEVQKYVGWHIAPSIALTGQRRWFGGDGYVPLRSTYVTSVDLVTIDGVMMVADQDYFWDAPAGYIRRCESRWSHDRFAMVNFTHGYASCPQDVKTVIFEVASTATELPASNANRVQTMQYTFELNKDIGVALSETQKVRLGRYRVPTFGGVPRA